MATFSNRYQLDQNRYEEYISTRISRTAAERMALLDWRQQFASSRETVIILQQLRNAPHATLNEFCDIVSQVCNIPVRGDRAIPYFLGQWTNVVAWGQVSDEVADRFAALYMHDKIRISKCELLVYQLSGTVLNMPVANSPTDITANDRVYWTPCTVSVAG
eukprot:Opistho-2@80356